MFELFSVTNQLYFPSLIYLLHTEVTYFVLNGMLELCLLSHRVNTARASFRMMLKVTYVSV